MSGAAHVEAIEAAVLVRHSLQHVAPYSRAERDAALQTIAAEIRQVATVLALSTAADEWPLLAARLNRMAAAIGGDSNATATKEG